MYSILRFRKVESPVGPDAVIIIDLMNSFPGNVHFILSDCLSGRQDLSVEVSRTYPVPARFPFHRTFTLICMDTGKKRRINYCKAQNKKKTKKIHQMEEKEKGE